MTNLLALETHVLQRIAGYAAPDGVRDAVALRQTNRSLRLAALHGVRTLYLDDRETGQQRGLLWHLAQQPVAPYHQSMRLQPGITTLRIKVWPGDPHRTEGVCEHLVQLREHLRANPTMDRQGQLQYSTLGHRITRLEIIFEDAVGSQFVGDDQIMRIIAALAVVLDIPSTLRKQFTLELTFGCPFSLPLLTSMTAWLHHILSMDPTLPSGCIKRVQSRVERGAANWTQLVERLADRRWQCMT